jgi:hypothetical protein
MGSEGKMKTKHLLLLLALLIPVLSASFIFITAFAQTNPLSIILSEQSKFYNELHIQNVDDPIYAESEITIDPYPVLGDQPTEICVKLRNTTPYTQSLEVTFSWANFGISTPFTTINGPSPVLLPPHALVNQCITWVPSISGNIDLQVMLEEAGYPTQYSQRNIDVTELLQPGVPNLLTFQVRNPLTETITINLGFIPYLPDWTVQLSTNALPNMAPGETRTATLTITPPAGQLLPADNTPVVDVEAYANGSLIGGIELLFKSEHMNYSFLPHIKK